MAALGSTAAVSRIAAILPNDLAPTNMNGPNRPLSWHFLRSAAARRTGLSLRLRKQVSGEFTKCGTKGSFVAKVQMSLFEAHRLRVLTPSRDCIHPPTSPIRLKKDIPVQFDFRFGL